MRFGTVWLVRDLSANGLSSASAGVPAKSMVHWIQARADAKQRVARSRCDYVALAQGPRQGAPPRILSSGSRKQEKRPSQAEDVAICGGVGVSAFLWRSVATSTP
jgi:hypothetical protein